ncbi:MAG: class I SAM-dependent methyltransferase [Defluviitaleaceae bacterium]|nr:class I SAM-dependent methyltransferase [Defluviitaleaceae bacterium]
MEKPFWEKTYQDKSVSTFSKEPTADLKGYAHLLNMPSSVLDVGCGEGRNSIFLAAQNHTVEAFDLSAAGIEKAIETAMNAGLNINFYQQDLTGFAFQKEYDVILSHGMLHLPEKADRDRFIAEVQNERKG